MNRKRATIYNIAQELGMSASYISRALNDYPEISETTKERIKHKAKELNYKHNSLAANLRQGASKTIGVVVPQINQSFFAEAVAGIEEVCAKHGHSLIIHQSHECFKLECQGIETLIRQNVDCILISVSLETKTFSHLAEILANDIQLIQFDRCISGLNSYKIVNDNKEAAKKAVQSLIEQGYRKVAFLGGPDHIAIFKSRKEGYLEAIKKAQLPIPYNFIVDDALLKEKTIDVVSHLLTLPQRPDAFFTVSDNQSLAILNVACRLGIEVPKELGIFGFANEAFTELIKPSLSSIDQKSKELGRRAAQLYFERKTRKSADLSIIREEVIQGDLIIRESSMRVSKRQGKFPTPNCGKLVPRRKKT